MQPPVLQLIFARRSVRVFAPGEVTEDQVRALLEAAMAAPSAVAKDPWRFVVIRSRAMLARIAAGQAHRLLQFARGLAGFGIALLSTGGTEAVARGRIEGDRGCRLHRLSRDA